MKVRRGGGGVVVVVVVCVSAHPTILLLLSVVFDIFTTPGPVLPGDLPLHVSFCLFILFFSGFLLMSCNPSWLYISFLLFFFKHLSCPICISFYLFSFPSIPVSLFANLT